MGSRAEFGVDRDMVERMRRKLLFSILVSLKINFHQTMGVPYYAVTLRILRVLLMLRVRTVRALLK